MIEGTRPLVITLSPATSGWKGLSSAEVLAGMLLARCEGIVDRLTSAQGNTRRIAIVQGYKNYLGTHDLSGYFAARAGRLAKDMTSANNDAQRKATKDTDG